MSRAMSSGISDDETSDCDLVAQGSRGEYLFTCPILYLTTYTFSSSPPLAHSSKAQRHLACRRTAESQHTSCKALSWSKFEGSGTVKLLPSALPLSLTIEEGEFQGPTNTATMSPSMARQPSPPDSTGASASLAVALGRSISTSPSSS